MENENKDKREQIEGASIKVIKIEAQEGSFGDEKDKIKKIIIIAINNDQEEIRISHKPKETHETYQDGIVKIRESLAMTPPNKCVEIGKEISKRGYCMVKAKYTVWQQWSNELNAYKKPVRYVQYGKYLSEWEIIGKEINTDNINGDVDNLV